MTRIPYTGLCSPTISWLLCSSLSLWSSISVPADLPVEGGFQDEGTFPLSQLPPRVAGLIPFFFFFFFLYFILLGYMVIFLVILVSWDLLPAFSSYSVRIVPTCRCIFEVFVGGGELQIFLFHHLDPAPLNSFLFCFFWMEVTKQQQYIKSIWSNVPFKASFLNDFLSGWSARWCKWDVKSSLLLLCYCQFFPLGLLIFVGYILGALLLGHIYL